MTRLQIRQLQKRAFVGLLVLLLMVPMLVGAFVFGMGYAPQTILQSSPAIDRINTTPANSASEYTTAPIVAPPALEKSDAPPATTLPTPLDRDAFRGRFAPTGIKAPKFLWYESSRNQIWFQEIGDSTPADGIELPPGVEARDLVANKRLLAPVILDAWLEAFELAYGACPAGGALSAPLTTIVFSTENEMRAWVWSATKSHAPYWAAGLYLQQCDVCLATNSEPDRLQEVVRHEMFHAFQQRVAPTCKEHRWFSEGSASWVDAAIVSAGTLVRNHKAATEAYGYLRHIMKRGYAPNIKELFALSPNDFYKAPVENYLLAYIVVDFLLERSDLKPVYFAYWKLMREGRSAQAAFDATIGKLDLDVLQKRMLRHAHAAPENHRVPQFVFDAALGSSDTHQIPMPQLGIELENEPEDELLKKLQAAGFNTDRIFPLERPISRAVICIDSNEPQALTELDLAAFNTWVACCRLAPIVQDCCEYFELPCDPPLSVRAAYLLVESVLLGRTSEFCAATGIAVTLKHKEYVTKFSKSCCLTADATLRDLYLAGAYALLALSDSRDIDISVLDVRDTPVRGGPRSGIDQLESVDDMAKTARKERRLKDEKGSDWLRALELAATQAGGAHTAILFFTHGQHRSGEAVGDDFSLASRLVQAWKRTHADRETSLTLIAAPGAGRVTLEELRRQLPKSRFDDWTLRFGR